MILIIGISTFVCISLGMLGVYWLFYKPQSAATERMRQLNAREGGVRAETMQSACVRDENAGAELARRLASPVNKLWPPSATETKKLETQLMHAGFRSPDAPII